MLHKLKTKIKQKLLVHFLPHKFYFEVKGFCPCCDKNVTFKAEKSWLRDNFLCSNCGCIPRERALMLIIEKYYPNWKELSIHETSPGNRGASIKLKQNCKNYITSQYYPNQPFGTIINGSRNEDMENQTFADESFDIVVSQDVIEHIYQPDKAFSEIARTLKPGGAHIFTVPIVNKHNKTERWAKKGTNNEPVFLNEPEYHGNPIDPKGSPVTFHWGYDIVDYIEKHTGMQTTIEYLYNLNYGVWAEYIEVLVSKKKIIE